MDVELVSDFRPKFTRLFDRALGGREEPGLKSPRVPSVTLVFPIAALALADPRKAVDRLDAHDELGVLVAELPFDAQTNRRAMADFQRLVVERVGQDGLGWKASNRSMLS